jgi:hypothetical protein
MLLNHQSFALSVLSALLLSSSSVSPVITPGPAVSTFSQTEFVRPKVKTGIVRAASAQSLFGFACFTNNPSTFAPIKLASGSGVKSALFDEKYLEYGPKTLSLDVCQFAKTRNSRYLGSISASKDQSLRITPGSNLYFITKSSALGQCKGERVSGFVYFTSTTKSIPLSEWLEVCP